jgi:hypothetical protein
VKSSICAVDFYEINGLAATPTTAKKVGFDIGE